jgi:Fe-S-cluster-containing hydrogenase component 2
VSSAHDGGHVGWRSAGREHTKGGRRAWSVQPAVDHRRVARMGRGPSPHIDAATPAARTVAVVHPQQCVLCGVCTAVCPTGAVELGDLSVTVIAARCRGCGDCVQACPQCVLELR